MASAGPPAGMQLPAFDDTIGALLIGGLISMALWGMALLQGFGYFMSLRVKEDRFNFKALIFFLLVLDGLDTAFICHILYIYIVKDFVNPLGLQTLIWSVSAHVLMTCASNFIIRSLFTQRIYRLSRGNFWLSGLIMAISLLDLISGLVITVKAVSIGDFSALDKLSTWFYIAFGAGTGADLAVAVTLSWLFWTSKTGLARTDSLLTGLVVYTVTTGFWVAVDAATAMLCLIIMPKNLIFLTFYLLLPKLYLNAYLASVSARDRIRAHMEETVSMNVTTSAAFRFTPRDGTGESSRMVNDPLTPQFSAKKISSPYYQTASPTATHIQSFDSSHQAPTV